MRLSTLRTRTSPWATAGVKAKRSAPPTYADHSTRTSCARSIFGSSAGFGPLGELNMPQAESASEADNTNASLIFLASERLQAHAHAFLESAVLLFRLLQRELVGGLRFGGLVFRQQDVAAHGGVLRFVG